MDMKNHGPGPGGLTLLEVAPDGKVAAKGAASAGCGCGPAGLAIPVSSKEDEPCCCGAPPPPRSGPDVIPGYKKWHFVQEFVSTPAGPVPRVKTTLSPEDRLGALVVRLGLKRENHLIAPGLYCVGEPGPGSPVLVTANYKLTFDALRKELAGEAMWLLVLDTRGINVWCAAGKDFFSSQETAYGVRAARLDQVVSHRTLILPQLAATGVSAREVRRLCGFTVAWGPVRARDVRAFVHGGMKIGDHARRVTFSLWERMVLIPVELRPLPGPSWKILAAIFMLSGIGTGFFSLGRAWAKGGMAAAAYGAGIVGGAILAPALLPWLRPKAFSLKGLITGLVCGAAVVTGFGLWAEPVAALALILFCSAVSSYLALNFTGATPFTSPSGVEKEMRRAIPAQAGAAALAALLWVASGFMP